MNIQALEKFCDDHEIVVYTYKKAAEILNNPNFGNLAAKGYAIQGYKDNMKMICYNDKLPANEKYLIFAHEVGHHVLEHMTNRKHSDNDNEIEADVFASVLMALSVFAETRSVTI